MKTFANDRPPVAESNTPPHTQSDMAGTSVRDVATAENGSGVSSAPTKPLVDKAWAPLSIPAYRSFWVAGLVSHLGTWMHETGAQWLMTSLEPSPEMVAAVRTAMTVPVFCLALPAGVWADRFNRRNWLLGTQLLMLSIAGSMAVLAALGWFTPSLLLLLTIAMGVAMILNQPAWQALTPELVPPALVPSAVAMGSMAFNLARSLGPATAGFLIAGLGIWATFTFNALSFVALIVVLLRWKPDEAPVKKVETQRFVAELRKGVDVVCQSLYLKNALSRVLIFAMSASIIWSLLPLVATNKLGFEERGFGLCLALMGAGAVIGAWFLPLARARYSSESLVLVAQLLFAAICLLIGVSHAAWLITPSLVVVGACWMGTMTTLNATTQVYLTRQYRARGMAAYMMSFSFGMASGSAIWGWFAYWQGLSNAFILAAATLSLTALAMHHRKIGSLRVASNVRS